MDQMPLDYILISLIVILMPGTGVLYTLAIGISRGFRASVIAALGCTLGIVPAVIASILGLAALLHTSALIFQIVKYIGVAYLFYMAWSILNNDELMTVKNEKTQKGLFKIGLKGALINVLNPKLSLFFLAFLPQFISSQAHNVTYELLILAGLFMLLTFIAFVGYGAFASLARDYVIEHPKIMRWIKRGFAGAFGFLGAKLALSD